MDPLEPPDSHLLSAAQGWFELGNTTEAFAEWSRLSPASQQHPLALELQWHLHAKLHQWTEAVAAAKNLVQRHPESPAGWLHYAYALRRAPAGGLAPAWDILHSAAERFPEETLIAYNLACYATQLQRPDEGWEWLLRAIQISEDPVATRFLALHDEDLQPIWPRIRGLP